MREIQMGAAEAAFADLVWEQEPIASGELARLCESRFGWKKTTAFTVLKRLCNKGIFQNRDGTVTSALSREAYYAQRGEEFIDTAFGGSPAAFLKAYTALHPLTETERTALLSVCKG